MKRPLYYLLCAIACTSMVGATMPMAAIAEAIQPQATAEQQAQADATSSGTGKAEDGTNTNATADTVEDSTATSTGTSQTDTADANATDTAMPGTAAATGTPTPSLRAQATPAPAAISATSQTGYAHSTTATQNGVTFTVWWNDAPAGTATTFHVTQADGSSQAKARMDVPTYWDGGGQESVCDPSRQAWSSYHSLGTAGHDFTFDFTASGTYRIHFYFMDNDRNDPQNDKGIYYLRTTAEVTVNDAARPSVAQIVNDAVDLCRQETNGSEYDTALWLHDWTLDQLEYDHSLNWCSAESGLTRHQGTCESYQRIYSKLLDAAGIANGRITGNGHTWNAVKIDDKWCQMDLTWDDTRDNWYGDLDQRHLYFGLTDELMAIAHSDHTANYKKADYAYRSTDLSNNYFVRNGKADEWAEKYADRIQQHLDAREESFSIDADNQLFPPSISEIQNGIIAHAMNRREWKIDGAKVELTVTSNVSAVSSYEWTTKFDFEAKYPDESTLPGRTVEDGAYIVRLAPKPSLSLAATGSGCALTSRGSAVRLTYDEAAGGYSVAFASGGVLTLSGGSLAAAADEGSASQRWIVRADGGEFRLSSCADGSAVDCRGARYADGNEVWTYAPNGGRAQAWVLERAGRTVEDGAYIVRLAPKPSLSLAATGSGCALTSRGSAVRLAYDEAAGGYSVAFASGGVLTLSGGSLAAAADEGSASQRWIVRADGGEFRLSSCADGSAVDCRGARYADGNEVWTYAPNGGRAQAWVLERAGRTVEDGAYIVRLAPKPSLSLAATGSGCALTSRGSAVRLAYDEAAGGYSVAFASGGVLTLSGGSLAAAADEGSASQRWIVRADGGEFRLSSCADGSAVDCRGARYADGNEVWTYAPNGGRAQAWVLERAGRTVEDGAYIVRLAPKPSLSLAATGSGCALTSRGSAVRLAYDEAAGGYSVAFASGGVLTLSGGSLAAAADEGSASQRWIVRADGGEFRLSSCADGSAVDCRGARYADGNEVWTYAPNGGRAQAWVLERAN